MAEPFTVLDNIPLFTLLCAEPLDSDIKQIFQGWPAESLPLLQEAQDARDNLASHIKAKVGHTTRIADIDRYLPLMISIEKEKLSNPRIGSSKDKKFRWKQTPLVVEKYIERSFSANYCTNEVLHLLWLKAVCLVNQASDDALAERAETAVAELRQAAGIFQYLAGDKCRSVDASAVPIEFQPPVFNSFMSLALAQVYAIIAQKGQRDGTSPLALGKICFTVSTSYQAALDAINTAHTPEAFHKQYKDWIEGCVALYHGCACALFAQSQWAKEQPGNAIGLARVGIADLKRAMSINKINARVNNAAEELLPKLEAAEKKYSSENMIVYSAPITDENGVNRFLASATLSAVNLPQPTPYSPPEPAGAPVGASTTPGVKKIGPPHYPM